MSVLLYVVVGRLPPGDKLVAGGKNDVAPLFDDGAGAGEHQVYLAHVVGIKVFCHDLSGGLVAVGKVAGHGREDEDGGIVELSHRKGLPEVFASHPVLVGQEHLGEAFSVGRRIHDIAPDGLTCFFA